METRKIFAVVIIAVILAIAGAAGYFLYREIARKPAAKGVDGAFDKFEKFTDKVQASGK